MQSEAARFDQIMRTARHGMRRYVFAIIPQPHPDALAQSLKREHDQLIVTQMISVPDNIGAGFIDAEHYQDAFLLGKRIGLEELANEFAHERKVGGVTAELDLLFHRTKETAQYRRAMISSLQRKTRRQQTKPLFSFAMWKSLLALLLVSTPAWAQEHGTAYDALRVVGTRLNREAVNHVISVTGINGNPQPETWKILLADKRARGGVREVEVANGRIVSERTPVRAIVGSTEGATIDTSHLNLDSSGAFSVASRTAEKSHTPFGTVSYTLRTDERSEPIWIVTLQNESRRPVGTIYIGANQGTVTRTEGMFNGAGMDQVVNADEAERETDEEENPDDENIVKRRIKQWFRQTKEDAGRMFHNVRRSFADFIRGDD
jgi:hypothetical protein